MHENQPDTSLSPVGDLDTTPIQERLGRVPDSDNLMLTKVEVRALLTEVARLKALVAAGLALHQRVSRDSFVSTATWHVCGACEDSWPCDTARALGAQPGTAP